ncbi:class I SAM-dependent methyltransferase [Pseudogemmobacter sp. W21_MBD1_M6]|uniref:class I SAM-dependent methyltransferase n=1 Tax=Pseudogemmobacter sp. W21_MBD1_M6 TaxID=3240271 RepID=UPI003F9A0E29
MALPVIASLWIGAELSWLEQLCLKSFLDHGHKVVLYTYDAVANVPEGVDVRDAAEILPSEKIIRHARTGSPAYHADLFRLHMLKKTDYIWADTDAYCCQPWDIKRGSHLHGWISDATPQVNNGVLRLPKTSKTLAAMLKFTSDEYPVPPWYGVEKQAELQALKDKGQGVHVSLLPWGIWGPEALFWFLNQTGEIRHSQPGHVLYPVPFANAGITLKSKTADEARALVKDDTLSIHFWGRRFRNIAAKRGQVPARGSFVGDLLDRHGIDPEKTKHLMQIKRPATPEHPGRPEGLDFSMFDDGDIANLVLQRSEVGATGPLVRQWMAGDEGPLVAYAAANRDDILTKAFDAIAEACASLIPVADDIAPQRIADIGCGYAFADLLLFRRYGADIVLIDIETSEARHFGLEAEGAGYSSLAKARAFLEANGVPADKITLLNPQKVDVMSLAPVDLCISLISCGYHYPANTYDAFFRGRIAKGGGVILDIRKKSGGVSVLKAIGTIEVLKKQDKHSQVLLRVDCGAA